MKYTVREVSGRREFKLFCRFQNMLYKGCPTYVPSLDFDQFHTLAHSPALDSCRQKLLLAFDERGKAVGRCCAIINDKYNEIYHTSRMRFGWMDYIDDIEVARALFDAAIAWGKTQGMTEIHGPMGYNTMYKQGMVVEGFDSLPQFNNLYNYSYYPHFLEQLGFVKEADWLQYGFSVDMKIPERIARLADALAARYDLKVADIEAIKKDKDIVAKFFAQYNSAFSSVRNFIPFSESEMAEEGANYIKQLDGRYSCILTDKDGDIAAFAICVPNISRALQKAGGSLFPLGWYHILKARRNPQLIDMMLVGVSPKWASKGISSILHKRLAESFRKHGVKACISNPQFEDNSALKVWDMYEEKALYIRRRCYIKPI